MFAFHDLKVCVLFMGVHGQRAQVLSWRKSEGAATALLSDHAQTNIQPTCKLTDIIWTPEH